MQSISIETVGLTRRFGSTTAVNDVSLKVPEGAVYGFLGPNGAGKTTTIRMLLGLIRPDSGTVRVMGNELVPGRPQQHNRVGAMVESPALYKHLTGRENLEVTRCMIGGDRGLVDEALSTVGLERASSRRAGEYSLGMKQRLGLAQALVSDPELLILDEPTNGLDPAGIQEMREFILSLSTARGITVFLSSHLLSEVEQMADHIGIINRGRLGFQGTLQELHDLQKLQLKLGVDDTGKATHLLEKEGCTVASDGGRFITIQIDVPDEASRFNSMLVIAGIGVSHLSLEKPSLEQIFLDMTETGTGAA